jgi:CBS domain-containing protein
MDRVRLQKFMGKRLAELPLVEPLIVQPTISVREAVATMADRSYSCAIAQEGDRVVGIFTERDVLTRCMDESFDWSQRLDAAVLTREPRTITPEHTVGDAIALMRKFGYRTLPVVDGGKVAGLIRLQNLLTHLAEEFPDEVLNIPPRPHQVMGRREGG